MVRCFYDDVPKLYYISFLNLIDTNFKNFICVSNLYFFFVHVFNIIVYKKIVEILIEPKIVMILQ